jgi:predicted RNase H-like HicB family nuclease
MSDRGRRVTYTVRVHHEDGQLWAEVDKLPGCFAAGDTFDELKESLEEAVSLYLSDEDRKVQVRLDEIGEVEHIDKVEERTLEAVCV